jgi:hypothetical protein
MEFCSTTLMRKPEDSPEGRTYVHSYRKGGGGNSIQYIAVIYKQSVTLKVQSNDKVVGLTELGRTQRNIGLLCAVLKVIIYSF